MDIIKQIFDEEERWCQLQNVILKLIDLDANLKVQKTQKNISKREIYKRNWLRKVLTESRRYFSRKVSIVHRNWKYLNRAKKQKHCCSLHQENNGNTNLQERINNSLSDVLLVSRRNKNIKYGIITLTVENSFQTFNSVELCNRLKSFTTLSYNPTMVLNT